MGQDPDAIRAQIEDTRGQMGDTIEAIGYKTDVKSRARDKVNRVMGKANDATPSTGDVKQGAQKAASVAQENPLGLAIGAIAVGFVAGMAIPSTSVEEEKLGPMADSVKEKAVETGQEALQHGKQVAQDVAQSAQETVRESGQQHAQELASSAQQ
jgi:gas vesicle protein